jgi:hypothetical protein
MLRKQRGLRVIFFPPISFQILIQSSFNESFWYGYSDEDSNSSPCWNMNGGWWAYSLTLHGGIFIETIIISKRFLTITCQFVWIGTRDIFLIHTRQRSCLSSLLNYSYIAGTVILICYFVVFFSMWSLLVDALHRNGSTSGHLQLWATCGSAYTACRRN